MAGRAVVSFTAAIVLMTACCALPFPSESEVVLLGEDAGWDQSDTWFHALEEEPVDVSASQRGTALGESDMPSYDEITHNMVQHHESPGEEAAPVLPSNPRMAPVPRNPYGQMVQDMDDMKLSQRRLNSDMRHYEKMQYHAASSKEQDAVNKAITAVQGLMNARKPNKKLTAAANDANSELMQASINRRKREKEGAKLFATAGYVPVEDVHDEKLMGPFTSLYLENLKMKRLEVDSKAISKAASAVLMSNTVRRDLTPNKAERRKEKDADDKFGAHDRGDSLNPAKAKEYIRQGKKYKLKANLVDMLHEAAESYKVAHFSDPSLTYEHMVEGTALQGIANFEAMNAEQKADYALKFSKAGSDMAQQEAKLAAMAEQYHTKFSSESRNIPYNEWEKTWTMDRQANMQVNPKEEKALRATVAKMKAAHEHSDVTADMRQVRQTHNDVEQSNDNEIAQLISDAPSKATLEKLTAQNILGAKQLAKDTAFANERLANETANPHSFGAEKELNPKKEPNYRATSFQAKSKEAHKAIQKTRKRLLKDANNLAKSGSKTDRDILNDDEKLVKRDKPPMDSYARHQVRKEQKHWQQMRERIGRKGVRAEKEGIAARYEKHKKAWKEVKDNVMTSGSALGLNYGASALKVLPTSSKDPALEDPAAFNLNGQSARVTLPMRKNSPTNNGLSKMPKPPADMNRMAVEDAEAEPKPKADFTDENKAIADGKTEEQVAKEQTDKEMAKAKREAAGVEGSGVADKLAGAGDSEKEIASATDSAALEKSVSKVEMPKAKPEVDEKGMPWDTKYATKVINDAQKGKSYAKGPQTGRSTASGVPQ